MAIYAYTNHQASQTCVDMSTCTAIFISTFISTLHALISSGT